MTLQVETLERELQQKTAEAEEVSRSEMEVRAKVEQAEEDLQERQIATYDIAADMVRDYKALQEELIYRINGLETRRMEQQEELDISGHELQELIRDKDEDIAHKDEQLQQLRDRMAEMSAEFMGMLTETLESLRVQGVESCQVSEICQSELTAVFAGIDVNARAIAT